MLARVTSIRPDSRNEPWDVLLARTRVGIHLFGLPRQEALRRGSARDAHVRFGEPNRVRPPSGDRSKPLVTGHFQRLVLGRYGGTPLLALTLLPIRGSAVSHVRRLVDRRVIRAETASSPSRTATATSPCPR